jgi:hypothetical protein
VLLALPAVSDCHFKRTLNEAPGNVSRDSGGSGCG